MFNPRPLAALPIGNSNFEAIRTRNCVYADKTEGIYRLVTDPNGVLFMARPRRFGKSLLIDTLYHLFSGHQHLFQGLWIEDKIDWSAYQYPVLLLDFSRMKINTPQKVEYQLLHQIFEQGKLHKISLEAKTEVVSALEALLLTLYQQRGPVVVLIDEYDLPITNNLHKPRLAEANREILTPLFATLKGLQKYLRFIFVTGITRYAKMSFFSAMNNLQDLTMHPAYETLFGITPDELTRDFKDWIEDVAQRRQIPIDAVLEEMKQWYNGYHWSHVPVYNPFSILHYLKKGQTGPYWFSGGGSPTMIVRLLQKYHFDLASLDSTILTSAMMDSTNLQKPDLHSLLWQAGYLTLNPTPLKDIYGSPAYTLRLPNHEIKAAFQQHLVQEYIEFNVATHPVLGLEALIKIVCKGQVKSFIAYWNLVFAQIPYSLHVPREAYYHSIIYSLCMYLSVDAHAEVLNHYGRLDLLIKTPQFNWLIEFKYSTDLKTSRKTLAKAGLKQLKEQHYHTPIMAKESHKTFFLIGFGIVDRQGEAVYETVKPA